MLYNVCQSGGNPNLTALKKSKDAIVLSDYKAHNPLLSGYPWLTQHNVWTCVIMEAFANGVNAGGHDYLSKLPCCFKMACIIHRDSEWEGGIKNPDVFFCVLKGCYHEDCCDWSSNTGSCTISVHHICFSSQLPLLKRQAASQSERAELMMTMKT